MKKCKACKKEIDSKATRCSCCRADQRNWFGRHKVISIFLAVIFWYLSLPYLIWKSGMKTIFKVVLIGLVWIIATTLFVNNSKQQGKAGAGQASVSSNSSNQSAPTETPVPTEAPIQVEASTLIADYDKNKLAAQEKYTGKKVQLTAFISNISQDFGGSYFLSLNPNGDQYYFGTSIKCTFPDKSGLTSLEKGQSVTVIGEAEDMSLGIVVLRKCELVK